MRWLSGPVDLSSFIKKKLRAMPQLLLLLDGKKITYIAVDVNENDVVNFGFYV